MEVELLAAAGLPRSVAWQAAASTAARLTRLDNELGALEPGKQADVVVLSGDPDDLTDLHNRVVEVFKDGTRVRRTGD